MAKIVNKEEKRRQIALSCKELFLQKGMKVTVSELAAAANIGKGTIYEYFKNKEDIVFEILNILIEEFNKDFFTKLEKASGVLEKLFIFSEFFYKDYKDLQKIYKEFLSITLTTSNKKMIDFVSKTKEFYYKILENILKDGVKNRELKEIAIEYKTIIYTMCEGLFIESEITNFIKNREKKFKEEINKIYQLLRRNDEI